MEVYKVVEKNTRHCSNWAIFKTYKTYKHPTWKKFRKDNIQYFPRYLKGKIIKSVKGSIGILVFQDKYDAERFTIQYNNVNLIIIKVKGIGNYQKVYFLKGNCGGYPNNILEKCGKMPSPHGTIAFESVEVLE